MVQIQAQYPDGSRSGITYSIFSGNKLQSFSIGSTTGKFAVRILETLVNLNTWNTTNTQRQCTSSAHLGEIWVESSRGLDFEETPRLRLVIKAETASSSSFMAVNLILQDVNDNLPRFQLHNYIAYVREAQGYDYPIIQVQSLASNSFIMVDFS